ncbi:MAG: hypothetical protein P8X79_15205 [Reinekea sp.]
MVPKNLNEPIGTSAIFDQSIVIGLIAAFMPKRQIQEVINGHR